MGSMFGDPQMQEVLSFALGINVMSPDQMGEEMGGGAAPPPAPAPAPAAPEPEPEPEEDLSQLTPEELKAREQRLAAVAKKEEGNAHYTAKRCAEALASYDAAIELDPKNMAFLLNKAAVYLEMKEIETCVATCKDAVAVGRENRAPFAEIAKAFVRAGNAYKKGGDLQAAIEEYAARARRARFRTLSPAAAPKLTWPRLQLPPPPGTRTPTSRTTTRRSSAT